MSDPNDFPIFQTIEGDCDCQPDIHDFVSCLRPCLEDELEIESAEQDR